MNWLLFLNVILDIIGRIIFCVKSFILKKYDQFFNQYAFGKLIYTEFDENNTFKTLRNSKYFKSLNNTTKVFINNDFKRYK
jgi:hypothetical protein